jgi:hypothetical protein
MKWRLHVDRCLEFFVKTDGCAVCIKECTFNQPTDRIKETLRKLLGKEVELRTNR